jgi:hypothetical protein
VTIPVPSGRYAARITGRGFVNHGWPGSTTSGDEWRLQLWPAAGPIPPRRVRSWMSRDLGVPTVTTHVSGILTKLDRNNRVQIAPLVHGAGLLDEQP